MENIEVHAKQRKCMMRRSLWSPDEDQRLIDCIKKYGIGRWSDVSKRAGLKRCGKSCRLRWSNYLKPELNHKKFTKEEEKLIIDMHAIVGNKWSQIAARLPGRTDNQIKNHWNSHIRRMFKELGLDLKTHKPLFQEDIIIMTKSRENKKEHVQYISSTESFNTGDTTATASSLSDGSSQSSVMNLVSYNMHSVSPQDFNMGESYIANFPRDEENMQMSKTCQNLDSSGILNIKRSVDGTENKDMENASSGMSDFYKQLLEDDFFWGILQFE